MAGPCSELCLHPAGTCPSITPSSSDAQDPPPRPQMTIVFNGRICMCDVSEPHARDIIRMAGEANTGPRRHYGDDLLGSGQRKLGVRLPSLTMRKSLERFLHERRTRLMAAFPYTVATEHRKQPPL